MTIYLSDRTGASIDSVLDNADAGNIGKSNQAGVLADLNTYLKVGFFDINGASVNAPVVVQGTLIVNQAASGRISHLYQTTTTEQIFIRKLQNSVWSAWKELYAKGTSKTNAEIDSVLDAASDNGMGSTAQTSSDFSAVNTGRTEIYRAAFAATDKPPGGNYGSSIELQGGVTGYAGSLGFGTNAVSAGPAAHVRTQDLSGWGAWEELYHTGNTGRTSYGIAVPSAGEVFTNFGNTDSRINIGTGATAIRDCMNFYNPNGLVGTIQTNATATAYNTSSDPRLKDFTAGPSDTDIDSKFNDLFGAFRTFNWKNDPAGDLVWGFDAHATIDAGLDVGSEGEGPRELALGDVYNTTPAVFEDQDQQVVYKTGDKKGEPKFYADGEPVMETISVEVTAAIDHKVSPAGVDQSKAVPILLAKIEQLERRLVAAGL